MSKAINQLNDILSLRNQARKLSLSFLEKLLDKFTVVIFERRDEEANHKLIKKYQLEKMEKIRIMMLNDCIDPAELILFSNPSLKQKKTKSARPPKYWYKDLNGEIKTWTGQGRKPKIIADLIAKGHKIEDFKIK